MSKGPPPGIARFDSAAAMAQASAAFLHGSDFASLSGSAVMDRLMPLANRLPRRPREWVYAGGGATEAIGARRASRLPLEGICQWLVGLFPRRTYDAAFIGSSNGALVHLAAAIGAPWLPQTFLCPVRRLGADPDDAQEGFAFGRRIAEALLAAHPHIGVHHMQDPNQDRLMLRTMSYFRLKQRRLTAAFRDFLARWLPPGATLYVADCRSRWPVTRTGERSVFQFGAQGGLTAEEYLHGGPRVRTFLARYGARRDRWTPPEPNDVAPEAEWGFDPALLDDLRPLAHTMGWRLRHVRFEHAEQLSWLAAAIYRDWYRANGTSPARLLVDSFVLMDPHRTVRLSAIPFWLVFATMPSAETLARYLDTVPDPPEVDIMLFSHGTESAGLAPIETWRALAARRVCGRLLGVDEARYPRDFATFTRYHRALEELRPLHEPPPPLPVPLFEELVATHGPRFGVELVPA